MPHAGYGDAAAGVLWAVLLAVLGCPTAAWSGESLSIPHQGERAAVGRLTRGDRSVCTGVLVAPRRVLTAAHCVVRAGKAEPVPAAKLRFAAGWRLGAAADAAGVAAVHLPDGYARPAGAATRAAIKQDVAWLRLARPLDAGPLPLARSAAPPERFAAFAYLGRRPSGQTAQHACTVTPESRDGPIWRTTCFASGGASGAPMLATHGPPRVTGIIVARHTRAAIAVPAARIRRLLPRLDDTGTRAAARP